MKWSLAFGSYRSQLYLSLRVKDRRMNAGRLIREICAGLRRLLGRPRQHGRRAAAAVRHARSSARRSSASWCGRFLEAFGVESERPVSLLCRAGRVIYWDYNAAAPLRPEVAARARRAPSRAAGFGNASSVHQGGREARARLDAARAQRGRVLGCEPKEVCFTGSGSEADALAIKGAFHARPDRAAAASSPPPSSIPRVLAALTQLERRARRWCGCARAGRARASRGRAGRAHAGHGAVLADVGQQRDRRGAAGRRRWRAPAGSAESSSTRTRCRRRARCR